MNFPTAVKTCLAKYASFSGRARRSEFWWFYLFLFLAMFVAVIVDSIIGTLTTSGIGIVSGVVVLALLLPYLAVAIRRLHDIDRSGWWMLLSFVPFGGFVLLVFFCLDTKPGDNKHGPNPKHSMAPGAYPPPPPAAYGSGQYSS